MDYECKDCKYFYECGGWEPDYYGCIYDWFDGFDDVDDEELEE